MASPASRVQLQAVVEVDFHTPAGSHVWIATLLPDPECGEERQRLQIKATADSEAAARDLVRLAAERIRGALEPIEEGA